ncbi:MAG: isochorismatase family protein [Acidaminococcaceae bacterium]
MPVTKLPEQKFIAAFDIDAQNTFTPLCPQELPIAGGDEIVPELNLQATYAALRIASRDAHSSQALWLTDSAHPIYAPIDGYPNLDLHWPAHAIVGTKGFDFIPGLDPAGYAYQAYKGIEPDKHPYGACYHNLDDSLSTGVLEFLRDNGITTVICGGLALDYCVKTTVLQLVQAGFDVILNLAATRGIAPDTMATALKEMQAAGVTILNQAAELQTLK